MRASKALSLEGEGWVRVVGAIDSEEPLTPTLSPWERAMR